MSSINKEKGGAKQPDYAAGLLHTSEQRVNFAYMLFMASFVLAILLYITLNDWDESRFIFFGVPCVLMTIGIVINAVFYMKSYPWIKYFNTLLMLVSIFILGSVNSQVPLLLVLIPFINSFYFKPWFAVITGVVSVFFLYVAIMSTLLPLYNADGSLNTDLAQLISVSFDFSNEETRQLLISRSFLLIIASAMVAFSVFLCVNVKKFTVRQGELTQQTLSAQTELNLARDIQEGFLSTDFPDNESYAICADMTTATEVGGDFYDYFMIDDTHLAVVIGDVSGHGIAAAMFMTLSKTLIKVYAQAHHTTDKVFELTNRYLLRSNPAKLFVTGWFGILDLTTGAMTYSNAGHNYPVIIRAGQKPAFLRSKPNFVLGRKRLLQYKENRVKLAPGDKLILYTDGVTEAQDPHEYFFSDERLLEVLDTVKEQNQTELVSALRQSVTEFENGNDHRDDATILALSYKAPLQIESPNSKSFFLTKDSFDTVMDYIAAECAAAGCTDDAVNHITIASSEILANIDSYAYEDGGEIEVLTKCRDRSMTVVFRDKGRPFNPLLVGEPDVSIPLNKRRPGGLGIFVVKKLMTDVSYVYENGQNVLTIVKEF